MVVNTREARILNLSTKQPEQNKMNTYITTKKVEIFKVADAIKDEFIANAKTVSWFVQDGDGENEVEVHTYMTTKTNAFGSESFFSDGYGHKLAS